MLLKQIRLRKNCAHAPDGLIFLMIRHMNHLASEV